MLLSVSNKRVKSPKDILFYLILLAENKQSHATEKTMKIEMFTSKS